MDKSEQPIGLLQQPHHIVDWVPKGPVHIPLVQHQGRAAAILVKEGQMVFQGQPLTHSDNLFEVPVHASITGTITAISAHHISLRHSDKSSIDQPEATTQSSLQPPIKRFSCLFEGWSRHQFINKFHSAGLIGLGGGCYPVAAKIDQLGSAPADTLLINAAECDPTICCDEALLNQSIDKIAQGVCLAQFATQAKKTIIGIESDKSAQGKSLLASIRRYCSPQHSAHTKLQIVPAKYPNGAESLLMSHCVGHKLTPADIHASQLITFNIGTCYSLAQALIDHKPSTHRIATVIDSNANKVNLRIPLGTSISELMSHFEENIECAAFIGGGMMGTEVNSNAVVTKASNCIQLKQKLTLPASKPCIRCSLCVDACPIHLKPQFLLSASLAANYTNLASLNLENCIECTCCDRACPSHIPLASIFAQSKKEVIRNSQARQSADLAKVRFEKRQARLKNSKQREFKKLDNTQSKLNQKENAGQHAKRQLVDEALQRARNKKQSKSNSSPTETEAQPTIGGDRRR